MNKFNIGDIVALKSGGPNMTIVNIDEDYEKIKCQWFNYIDNVLGEGIFRPLTLILKSE